MPTKLAENIQAIDLCTYLTDAKTLIISDLHLGYEESLSKKGTLVPRTQYKRIIKRLEWILKQVEVKHVVMNGDIKHEFGTISKQEWREVIRLIDFFDKKNIKITAIKGNHDTILGPIARRRNIREVKEIRHKNILITHGDYEPKKPLPIIIMGHEHPAIVLRDDAKAEKFKCFIKGKYKKSTLIVQPSLNPLTEGTDISKQQVLSPLIHNLDKFEVFIVDDKSHEVLPFGKLVNISKR